MKRTKSESTISETWRDSPLSRFLKISFLRDLRTADPWYQLDCSGLVQIFRNSQIFWTRLDRSRLVQTVPDQSGLVQTFWDQSYCSGPAQIVPDQSDSSGPIQIVPDQSKLFRISRIKLAQLVPVEYGSFRTSQSIPFQLDCSWLVQVVLNQSNLEPSLRTLGYPGPGI